MCLHNPTQNRGFRCRIATQDEAPLARRIRSLPGQRSVSARSAGSRARKLPSAMPERRRFLTLAGRTFFARGPARAATAVPVDVAIDYEDSGRPIAENFTGLSY